MNIVLLGSPGVGKGTYAAKLEEIYNLPHISTGDLFRENQKTNTELWHQAEPYYNSGKLVPDEITIGMLKDRIANSDCKKGFLLDGFPRTIAQAEALGKITKIDKVLNFSADESTIISRLSARRTCKDCGAIYHLKNVPPKQEGICDKCGGKLYQRSDEKKDVVKERLKEYNKQTKPLIDFYEKKGLLVHIDANTDIGDPNFHVITDCQKVLDEIKV